MKIDIVIEFMFMYILNNQFATTFKLLGNIEEKTEKIILTSWYTGRYSLLLPFKESFIVLCCIKNVFGPNS